MTQNLCSGSPLRASPLTVVILLPPPSVWHLLVDGEMTVSKERKGMSQLGLSYTQEQWSRPPDLRLGGLHPYSAVP